MTTRRPEEAPGVWVDPDPVRPDWSPPSAVDPTWTAPPDAPDLSEAPDRPDDRPVSADATAADPEPPPSRRRLLVGLGVVAAVAILVGLVAGFGGFTQRRDLATPVPPGTTIATGPYEMTFTDATVQRTESLSKPIWRIVVRGTGRTTGDVAIAPEVGLSRAMFAMSGEQRQVVLPEIVRYGTEERIGDGSTFTPGLPPIAMAVEFEIEPPYTPPADRLSFAVWSQEFRDTSLLGNQDPSWANGKQYWRYELPLQRLADDVD